ncbi:hypothetical protein MNV49_000901 [Pseudohyphozyma bogoriensis]|nr:hypothetical protein MNV49_000901 [Pseudohyphozyma bogoriensis]
MRDWATVHRSIATKSPLPSITPLFNYALIDSQAAGDIEAILPDPSVVESSKEVPIHRYDWWASAENAHSWALEQTTVPDGLSGKEVGDLGKPLPWKEWDPSKPVRHVVLHFSEAEVEKMWMEASGGITGTEVRISRSDALLAHMWQLVIRARNPTDGEVHLDVTLGTRARLDLPPSTLGSPLFNIPVTSTPSTLFSSTSLSSIARLLRTSVSRYTRSAIASLLHRWSHDTAPWRYWDCFLGERHTIVTSWLRAGSWDVVFEEGVRPVYVAPIMPSCDGCLCLAEAGAGGWKAGVDVHLLMKDDVVKKILADEALRRFGS